jgi:hypothetical protein
MQLVIGNFRGVKASFSPPELADCQRTGKTDQGIFLLINKLK